MVSAIKKMLAERERLSRGEALTATDRFFDEVARAKIKHFFNEGWDGRGWPPFSLLEIGYSALATLPSKSGGFAPKREREAKSQEFWRLTMNEARRRYREGFYADPFTTTPRRRPPTP